MPANDYFDIELTRTAGNPMNIQAAPETTGPVGSPPILAKGKILYNAPGTLQACWAVDSDGHGAGLTRKKMDDSCVESLGFPRLW